MEEELKEKVSYLVFEGEMTRMERVNHRLWVLCICLLIALIGTNAGWIWYENQFIDEVTVTQESDGGYNNYVDGDGTINN